MSDHHGTIGSWAAASLTLVFLCLAFTYLRGWWHLFSAQLRVSAWRAASFLGGLLLIWVALASPIATLDHELLTAHMIQHLLLMALAPPLIWLGEPLMVLSSGLPRQFLHAAIDPLLHWLPIRQLGKETRVPVFCLLAASAALVGWHFPAAFALTMKSGTWHMVQQVTFLATGLLFWWPVVQPWPSVSRPGLPTILYLFFATLPCDALSGFLVFCDRVVYPSYFSSSHLFGFSALGDQQCAGALMWTCVTIVYVIAGVLLTMQLLSPQHVETDKPAQSNGRSCAAQNLIQQRVEAT